MGNSTINLDKRLKMGPWGITMESDITKKRGDVKETSTARRLINVMMEN